MAVKIIGEKAGTNNPHDYLSALFHPLGRIILATLYPNLHRKITREALETGKSLDAVELETFGMSSFQVTSICMAAWKIPTNTTMSLQYLGKDPSELSDLPSPLRKRVTIIKLARLLSQIALGLWEDFDLIDLPSSEAVKALQLPSANELIAAIKARYLQEHSVLHSSKDKTEKLTPERIKGMITYFSAGEPGADLLLPLLCSFKLPIKLGAPTSSSATLINGLDLTSDQEQDLEKKYDKDKLFGVVPPGNESSFFLPERQLPMPASVSQLRNFAKRCL